MKALRLYTPSHSGEYEDLSASGKMDFRSSKVVIFIDTQLCWSPTMDRAFGPCDVCTVLKDPEYRLATCLVCSYKVRQSRRARTRADEGWMDLSKLLGEL